MLTNESGCFKFLFYLRKWKKSQTHDRKALAPGRILGITVVMAHQSLQSHGHQELLENDKKKMIPLMSLMEAESHICMHKR